MTRSADGRARHRVAGGPMAALIYDDCRREQGSTIPRAGDASGGPERVHMQAARGGGPALPPAGRGTIAEAPGVSADV